ncbi:MAG: GNAT family N-acetyltransferase [Chloroflexi bacterium]|nr:GNAT family N-acetyltransferase [Chloroflexota bacterium]
MLIRPATSGDLAACLALDESYTTNHVWQIEARSDEEAITVSFRPIRLPRPLTVQPADVEARRQEAWPRCHCILVATEGPDEAPARLTTRNGGDLPSRLTPRNGGRDGKSGRAGASEVRGILTLMARPWPRTGWIEDLVVAPAHRRQGVGRALLGEARRWAQRQGLSALLAQASTQNYPAICFYQECGFTFCGFHEHYYPNRDIALFFVAPV